MSHDFTLGCLPRQMGRFQIGVGEQAGVAGGELGVFQIDGRAKCVLVAQDLLPATLGVGDRRSASASSGLMPIKPTHYLLTTTVTARRLSAQALSSERSTAGRSLP